MNLFHMNECLGWDATEYSQSSAAKEVTDQLIGCVIYGTLNSIGKIRRMGKKWWSVNYAVGLGVRHRWRQRMRMPESWAKQAPKTPSCCCLLFKKNCLFLLLLGRSSKQPHGFPPHLCTPRLMGYGKKDIICAGEGSGTNRTEALLTGRVRWLA